MTRYAIAICAVFLSGCWECDTCFDKEYTSAAVDAGCPVDSGSHDGPSYDIGAVPDAAPAERAPGGEDGGVVCGHGYGSVGKCVSYCVSLGYDGDYCARVCRERELCREQARKSK